MLKLTTLLMAAICFVTTVSHAATVSHEFDSTVKQIFNDYYQEFKPLEYFSGATLSIYIPGHEIQNYYEGQVAHDPKSAKVDSSTLFQIGSITKSFTAALMLQLEKEDRLDLEKPFNIWLPEYSKWGAIPLIKLLNMSSGLPNYSDAPLWNAAEYQTPQHVWTSQELISFVYPKGAFTPPLKRRYFYTNTGYILAGMIIEKITHQTLQQEFNKRLFKPVNLENTFYPLPSLPKQINARVAHGYNYNQYDNPELVGMDLENHNLSWAAAAGGILSTSEDIIKWVKALFIDKNILDTKEKHKLTNMVSIETGKNITTTIEQDPSGFGLGVTQHYFKPLGSFWFYEGQTLGFRALYIYTPCNGIIIASTFNSSTNPENDHSKDLVLDIYDLILDHYPKLEC